MGEEIQRTRWEFITDNPEMPNGHWVNHDAGGAFDDIIVFPAEAGGRELDLTEIKKISLAVDHTRSLSFTVTVLWATGNQQSYSESRAAGYFLLDELRDRVDPNLQDE